MAMSTLNSTLNDAERGVTETIRTYSPVILLQGIIMMVLGAAAIVWPHVSTLAVDLYAGWTLLLSALTGLLAMFIASSVIVMLAAAARSMVRTAEQATR
jgi:uncharacterized membrane protein HdeD (DUF308 family)